MIQTFTDNDGNEVVPFGSAAVTVKNGLWTFNGKQVSKGDVALQMFVSRFIAGCRLAFPVKEKRIHRVPSHSVIATQKAVMAHGHLKEFNYQFPPTREEKLVAISYLPEINVFPEFIPKSN